MNRVGFLGFALAACLSVAHWQSAEGQPVMRETSFPAQDAANTTNSASSVPLRTFFEAYIDAFFQEKVFVHLNKDSYQEDEIMWLKAYRVDAATHFPQLYSGIVYAEIFDPTNKQIARLQLKRDSTGFQGSFKIPLGAVSGYYTLTAYTYWMQNYPSEFYFSRRFYVQNQDDISIRSSLEFEPDYAGRRVLATATFTDEFGEPYHNSVFRVVYINDGVEMGTYVGRANKEGRFRFQLSMDSLVSDVRISFDHGEAEKYSRNFKVPFFDDRLDVQFMPEGGHLLGGVTQRVAFKVVGADGKSAEAGGSVVDGQGNTVATLQSVHKGMGTFRFIPKIGEEYTARVTAADGRKATVLLPEVAAAGVGIVTSMQFGILNCRTVATAGFDYRGLNFVMQCRGKVLMWKPLSGPQEMTVNLKQLPEGIIHLFVVDDNGRVYSERLVFVNRDESAKMAVNGLKSSYGRRSQVEAEVDLSGLGVGQDADLSVSVVDTRRSFAVPADNIASYLLMSSDIKGTIEEPWYYFDTNVDFWTRAAHADLLMMTQGWKRFDVADICRRTKPRMDYPIELGQSVSGRIVNRWNEDKKLENPKLTMLAPSLNRVWLIEPDTAGYFQVSDVAFPNKTIFMIQGMQKNNRSGNIQVVIDEHKFRPYTPKQYDRGVYLGGGKTKTAQEMSANDEAFNFYDLLAPKFYYDENGQKIFLMRDITVMASRKDDLEAEMWGDDLLLSTTPEDILDAGIYHSVRDWLMGQDGVEIVDDTYYDDLNGDHNLETVYINGKRARFIVGDDEYINYQLWKDRFDADLGPEVVALFNPKPQLDSPQDANGETSENPEASQEDDNSFPDPWVWQILEMPMSAISKISIIEAVTGLTIEDRTFYGILVQTKNSTYRFDKLSMFEFYPLGYNEPDEFYRPVYSADDDDLDPDQRVALHWDPALRAGPDGKAKISFYTNDIPSQYLMTIQGITSKGQPVVSRTMINVQ